jgi:hypothetical protein
MAKGLISVIFRAPIIHLSKRTKIGEGENKSAHEGGNELGESRIIKRGKEEIGEARV